MSKSLDFFDLEAAIWTTSEPLRRGALELDRPGVAISAVLPAKPAARRVGDKRCVGDETFRHFRGAVVDMFAIFSVRIQVLCGVNGRVGPPPRSVRYPQPWIILALHIILFCGSFTWIKNLLGHVRSYVRTFERRYLGTCRTCRYFTGISSNASIRRYKKNRLSIPYYCMNRRYHLF